MAEPRAVSAFAAPPRSVPLSLRLRALTGGFYNQFGWAFLGFGMIFFWIFGMRADLSSILFLIFRTETANGSVLDVRETAFSEGDDSSSGSRVFQIRFAYSAGGRSLEATSYATGYFVDPGQRVSVEYLSSDASTARIQGMRRQPFGPAAVAAGLFPLIGLGFLLKGLSDGIKANRLLGSGRLARGKLKSVSPTNTRINNRPVLALAFEFTAVDGGTYFAVAKTHQPEPLQDELEEPVLYDPNDPTTAVLLDSIPGSPRLDPAGSLMPAQPRAVLAGLLLPALTLAGHGVYLAVTLAS